MLCRAIDQFTALQLAVADRVDVLLNIGVPDWRLNKIPSLYQEILLQKELLKADGLSEIEMQELETLLPKLNHLCKQLSAHAIKQTIVQPDFNDNNTLIDEISQAITLTDLGEIAISHPFFSLLNCLYQIKKHLALTENDEAFIKIKNACLVPYIKFESKENVLIAFSIVTKLWLVYNALAQYRLMLACGKKTMLSLQRGKLSGSLREFMNTC